MRNPQRWRTINLIFLGAGIVATIAAFALPAGMAGDSVRTTLFIFGPSTILFGGGSALFRHFDVRAERKLLRGEDVVARWHVDADTWRRFITLDRKLCEGPGGLPNEFSARAEAPAGGVDVVAGKSAVSIDGSIHLLGSLTEITRAELKASQGSPSYVEFELYYPSGGYGASGVSTSESRTVLRFPVAPGAERDAAKLVALFDGSQPRKPDFFHGRGDGSNTEDLNTCWSCGYATHQLLSNCPQCGSSMQTRRWSRRLGCVLIPCGLFITGVMGVVLHHLAPMLLHPGVTYGTSRFSGTPSQALPILALLCLPFVFGVTALAYGIWQVGTGRRSRKVVGVMLGTCALLLLAALGLWGAGR